MHRFTVNTGSFTFPIDVEDYKFLIGKNYNVKFQIYETLKAAFNKVGNSEYAIETMNKHSVIFDEKIVDSRNWKFFEVTPFFDLETDLKIGTKSLIAKYLETFNFDLENNEIFNTIMILVNSLNEEFFDKETLIEINQKEFQLKLSDITKSTILKEVIAKIICDEFECNSADMNYEDKILLQLSIIHKIANQNKDKLLFVYLNAPYITPKIKNSILGFKYQGSFMLVDTLKISNISLEKCIVTNKHYIDFANIDLILDKMMDFPFHIEISELKNECQMAIESNNYDFNNPLIFELF